MATRASFVKAMVKDSYEWAIESYEQVPTVFDQIFATESSDSAYEQYASAIGPGAITEIAEGVSIPRQSAQEGYTVYCSNKKYPTELPLTNEAIDDNTKVANFLKAWAGGLGESIRNKQEETHANVFTKGGFTSGDATTFSQSIPGVLAPSYGNLTYDGKPFFALSGNNHPAKNGATYYNSIATLPLSGANLETISKIISVTNAFNEAGMEIQIMPDTLLVQYGSANYYKAKRILESMADVDAAQSGVTNVWKGSLSLIGWRFLTNADAWFVGCRSKGLISLNRMPLKIDYYEDQNTDSQIVRSRARWGRAVRNFRYWAAAGLATS
jgi:hypothetical protein